jgi:hypothetical protein
MALAPHFQPTIPGKLLAPLNTDVAVGDIVTGAGIKPGVIVGLINIIPANTPTHDGYLEILLVPSSGFLSTWTGSNAPPGVGNAPQLGQSISSLTGLGVGYTSVISFSRQTAINVGLKGLTTVSFSEIVRGWVSFKSFTPENALSVANEYYTFMGGELWKHHSENAYRNTFYRDFTSSRLSVILNELPGSVKSFNTLNYEGSQCKITKFTVDPKTGLADEEYYNLNPKDGWFVDYIFTNKEEGSLNEFIEKEGKWFNYIKGKPTLVNSTSDLAAFNVQGLGVQIATVGSIVGCTNSTAMNYDPLANEEDGSCEYSNVVNGCTSVEALNYNPFANTDDGTCNYAPGVIFGCMDPLATNHDPLANIGDGSCIYPGCTDPTANNYNAAAIVDDGSCDYAVYGCMDQYAFNYNPNANTDDGSCNYTVIDGCTNPNSANYNPLANTDDGSCIAPVYGCTIGPQQANQAGWDDPNIINVNQQTNPSTGLYTFTSYALYTGIPVYPGTAQGATNYYAGANIDDGSCIFNPIIPQNPPSND